MLTFDAMTQLPLDVTGLLKTSSGLLKALPDREFAFICIGPRNQKIRRFPCHTVQATKTSAAFLQEFSDVLPSELVGGIAANLCSKAQDQQVELPETVTKLSSGVTQAQWLWDERWDEEADQARANLIKLSQTPAPAPVVYELRVPGNPLTGQEDQILAFRGREDLEKTSEWLVANRDKVSSYQEKVMARGILDGFEAIGIDTDGPWAHAHLSDLVKLSCGPRRETILAPYFEDRPLHIQGIKMSAPSGPRKRALDAYESCLREIHEIDDAERWTDPLAVQYAWKLSHLEQALDIQDKIRAFDVFFHRGRFKGSQPKGSPVVWSKGLMVLREEDLLEAKRRNLKDLETILGKDTAEALALDPVKVFRNLEIETQNYVGTYLYDAGHGPRRRGQ